MKKKTLTGLSIGAAMSLSNGVNANIIYNTLGDSNGALTATLDKDFYEVKINSQIGINDLFIPFASEEDLDKVKFGNPNLECNISGKYSICTSLTGTINDITLTFKPKDGFEFLNFIDSNESYFTNNNSNNFEIYSGNVPEIGKIQLPNTPVNDIPNPNTLPLLLLGLAGMRYTRREK